MLNRIWFEEKTVQSMVHYFGLAAKHLRYRWLQGKTASLSRGLNSSYCRIDKVRHRRFGIWRNAADVDFAKNIGILVIVVLRTEQEIAIPENGKTLCLDF